MRMRQMHRIKRDVPPTRYRPRSPSEHALDHPARHANLRHDACDAGRCAGIPPSRTRELPPRYEAFSAIVPSGDGRHAIEQRQQLRGELPRLGLSRQWAGPVGIVEIGYGGRKYKKQEVSYSHTAPPSGASRPKS